MSTSSLLSGSNTVVHLSSFQSGNQQSNSNTNTLPLPPPPPPQTKSVATAASATKPVLTNGILANSQPPKPPERSCSFKDVDNLQQQQQTVESTTTTSTNNNSQNSKRQRSLTNKEPSGFCLKSLMNAVQTTPVVNESVNNSDANQISNRPISRHFGNTDSPQQQQQQSNIKITSMKFGNEIINSSDLNLKNGWY